MWKVPLITAVLTLAFLWKVPAATAAGFGSVTGTITWQYNNYVGTKGDVGASIVLFPPNAHCTFDKLYGDSVFILGGDPEERAYKCGIRIVRADGYGHFSLNHVPVGRYYIVVVSSKTTRNPDEPLESYLIAKVSPLFASKESVAAFSRSLIKFKKSDIDEIVVRVGESTDYSHDFGNTYM